MGGSVPSAIARTHVKQNGEEEEDGSDPDRGRIMIPVVHTPFADPETKNQSHFLFAWLDWMTGWLAGSPRAFGVFANLQCERFPGLTLLLLVQLLRGL